MRKFGSPLAVSMGLKLRLFGPRGFGVHWQSIEARNPVLIVRRVGISRQFRKESE